MRTPRKFQPSPPLVLEERALLSHVVRPAASVRPAANVAVSLTPAEMVPGAPAAPPGGNTFPLSISATLQAGLPVYEQRETTFSTNVAPRLVDELIVPDGGGVITTTQWISLKNNGGIEKSIDVKSVSGATVTHHITTTLPSGKVRTEVETALSAGKTTTHTNVTTLPGGTVRTNRYTEIKHGKTVRIVNGSEPGPGGSITTYSGTRQTAGKVTTTTKTYLAPAGLLRKTRTVVTSAGAAGSSETVTTTRPHHRMKISSSSTVILRLNPPGTPR